MSTAERSSVLQSSSGADGRLRLAAARVAALWALGPVNVGRVLCYRVLLRSGLHPVQRLSGAVLAGPFFGPIGTRTPLRPPARWQESATAFGWQPVQDPGMPSWDRNALTGARATRTSAPWWTISDFDAALGDIKGVWELSRFDWVVTFAQHAAAGDDSARHDLNAWLADWCARNPPYRGPNWKCGQEASIRVLHLAVAALVTAQVADASQSLAGLVDLHLRRIAPTVSYARGQSNNHATSEAAALFIGGSWRERLGDTRARRWTSRGRRLLEACARTLIEPDGSFSQYSVNYHRLMLDTFALAEVWRRRLDLPRFTDALYARVAAATEWLRAMVQTTSGDAPVLGANDGALLLRLTDSDYRDHRPSVQLASALFLEGAAFAVAGPWSTHLRWLGLTVPERPLPPPSSRLFDDGGYAVLRVGAATALLRYPRFRFRPSHADALHVDLWLGDRNVLRDAGSFSYFDAERSAYFSGASGHNTIQFDDHEQMPRLGRFLWGRWLETTQLEQLVARDDVLTVGAAYVDRFGASHLRRLELRERSLTVRDRLSGFRHRAVLRFRLQPGHWKVEDDGYQSGTERLIVTSRDASLTRRLVEGWESRYYGQKTVVPVAEITMPASGEVVSVYRW
jgi:hypothetical protein